jgi:hypothetical protein
MSQACATCRVSISGSFDVHWVDYLGDILLYADVSEGYIRTTTLFGKPPDLAAFMGMLNLLADFGFVVIACEYHRADVSQDAAASGAGNTRGVGIERG